jgi:hypothetical protein
VLSHSTVKTPPSSRKAYPRFILDDGRGRHVAEVCGGGNAVAERYDVWVVHATTMLSNPTSARPAPARTRGRRVGVSVNRPGDPAPASPGRLGLVSALGAAVGGGAEVVAAGGAETATLPQGRTKVSPLSNGCHHAGYDNDGKDDSRGERVPATYPGLSEPKRQGDDIRTEDHNCGGGETANPA